MILWATGAAAQPGDERTPADATPAEEERRERQRNEFYGQLAVSGVAADSIDDEEEDIARSALIGRGAIGYVLEQGSGELRIEASSAYYEYLDEGRDHRWSNGIEAEYLADVGRDWRAGVGLEYDTNLATVEFGSTDQLQARGMLEYEPNRANRARFHAGWRERSYDDLQDSSGSGPFAELDYRYRFGRYHYLTAEMRYERIDSDHQIRDFDRIAFSTFYTHPLSRDARLRGGVMVRHTDFRNRPVLEHPGESRRDWLIMPEIELLYDVSRDWRLETELRYINRRSNDPDFDREGYRAEVSLVYDF
jgi:hypothetical protein